MFVDAELRPYPDQWAFLATIRPMAAHDIEPTILRATGGVHPLDVTFITCDLHDERYGGELIDVTFVGTLRLDQEAAVSAMAQHDTGVLCAPTAFGKTVTAAAMIARRGVNTPDPGTSH